MADIQLVNKMEAVVHSAIDAVKHEHPQICFCERCRLDILALALNALAPRYVVTTLGEVVTQVNLESNQWRAEVMVAVLKAIDTVKSRPRH